MQKPVTTTAQIALLVKAAERSIRRTARAEETIRATPRMAAVLCAALRHWCYVHGVSYAEVDHAGDCMYLSDLLNQDKEERVDA